MAITQHGNQDYVFGFNDTDAATLAATLGMAPTELRIQGEPEFTASAQDESGETVSHVVGGESKNFTMSGYITNDTLFNAAAGTGFSYDSQYFIIESVSRDEKNQDFVRGEFTGKSFPRITSQTTAT